jgi:hypothetical protein
LHSCPAKPGTVLVVIGLVATFVGGPEALSLFALNGVVSTNGQAITRAAIGCCFT